MSLRTTSPPRCPPSTGPYRKRSGAGGCKQPSPGASYGLPRRPPRPLTPPAAAPAARPARRFSPGRRPAPRPAAPRCALSFCATASCARGCERYALAHALLPGICCKARQYAGCRGSELRQAASGLGTPPRSAHLRQGLAVPRQQVGPLSALPRQRRLVRRAALPAVRPAPVPAHCAASPGVPASEGAGHGLGHLASQDPAQLARWTPPTSCCPALPTPLPSLRSFALLPSNASPQARPSAPGGAGLPFERLQPAPRLIVGRPSCLHLCPNHARLQLRHRLQRPGVAVAARHGRLAQGVAAASR